MPAVAKVTIEGALAEFLDSQRGRLSPRSFWRYEEVLGLLRHCLEYYGYESLGGDERARFEEAFAAGDEEGCCKGFGLEHIAGYVGVFLYYFMVHKVTANRDLLRAAGTVAGELVTFLYDQGYVSEAECAEVAALAVRATRDLPRAEQLAALLYKESTQLADYDLAELSESDWLEGCPAIEAVASGALWFEGALGPVEVPAEASALAQVGWNVTVTLARVQDVWRLIEVANVYP